MAVSEPMEFSLAPVMRTVFLLGLVGIQQIEPTLLTDASIDSVGKGLDDLIGSGLPGVFDGCHLWSLN